MAERNPPAWLAGGTYAPDNDRWVIAGLTQMLGEEEGVVSNGLEPGVASGTMVTAIKAGHAFIKGDNNAHQGTYHVYNDASVTIPHDPSSSSQRRIDLVVAEILDDAFIGGGTRAWRLRAVKGAETSGTAVVPATPASAIPLAEITIDPAVTTISLAKIKDVRVPVNTPPTVMAYRASLQAIPSGIDTLVAFPLEHWDTHGFHDKVANTSRLTIPVGANLGGLYIIGGQMQWEVGGLGEDRSMRILLNGSTSLAQDRDPATGAKGKTLQATTLAFLKGGDFIEMMVSQNSGVSLNINPGDRISPLLWMARLGATLGGQL